ncbi:tRNA (adenosine(37)-N6)-threonylcarbamoyltransferase complex dimerization subunit type 1 TsaB [Pseudoruegeria sp. SK021]|uniref:tRNA (adenosine(37)-N6)-threonylcarbamoyltransferase complex dimerization subunit type 1 TsaB n=1 Tax=Pseudoruegeria sp. SK021 TaxID=1933035 RepID=UPI000A230123|nr:tRNA (adenosine(37)-N6)-threonylcarbamoyltransferase complex dimerization subunit type 1 TsaB [Pseudoruegeria sp. SK021]OSP56077.1 tRNA (adenosine(37)-N6)-threonylcarbamoyltransferase complex dimerization subunit type 1 TsaB [Pseudoruegeria sp. SK021]
MTQSPPLVLGFDTSGPHCIAALIQGDRVLGERSEAMVKGQAERLIPLLEDLLAEAGLIWRELDGLGVGIGPGNFTGIRISVAAARGLALSLRRPAIGVSTLEAAAHGLTRPVLSCADARKDMMYLQLFDGSADNPAILVAQDDPIFQSYPAHLACVGDAASRAAERTGGPVLTAALPLAQTIARIASSRLGDPATRPSPLYIRNADAAPARDLPPVVLP